MTAQSGHAARRGDENVKKKKRKRATVWLSSEIATQLRNALYLEHLQPRRHVYKKL